MVLHGAISGTLFVVPYKLYSAAKRNRQKVTKGGFPLVRLATGTGKGQTGNGKKTKRVK